MLCSTSARPPSDAEPDKDAEEECDACAGTGRYGLRDDDECGICHGSGILKNIECIEAATAKDPAP